LGLEGEVVIMWVSMEFDQSLMSVVDGLNCMVCGVMLGKYISVERRIGRGMGGGRRVIGTKASYIVLLTTLQYGPKKLLFAFKK
jgi:hypothetical protein